MFSPKVNGLIDYCHGREAQGDDVGAVARFLEANVEMRPFANSNSALNVANLPERPAGTGNSRWPDIDALKAHARFYGPACTPAQIDTALAAAGL